jgi:ankyrin repeat protein
MELYAAVRAADTRAVRRLLAAGASVDERGQFRETPLHAAASLGHVRIATLLVEHQAAVNAKSYRNETPLHLAAAAGALKIVELLLEHGARSRAVTEGRDTALHEAAGRDDLPSARAAITNLLLECGCPVDGANRSGQTALWRAAANGHIGVVRALLAYGANPKLRAKGQQGTALEAARMFDQGQVARLLERHLKAQS